MQDPVTVAAEGDALLLRLLDRGGDVVLPDRQVRDRPFVLPDHVVKVNHCGVRKPAIDTNLFRSVLKPFFLVVRAFDIAFNQFFLFIVYISLSRIFALFRFPCFFILKRH